MESEHNLKNRRLFCCLPIKQANMRLLSLFDLALLIPKLRTYKTHLLNTTGFKISEQNLSKVIHLISKTHQVTTICVRTFKLSHSIFSFLNKLELQARCNSIENSWDFRKCLYKISNLSAHFPAFLRSTKKEGNFSRFVGFSELREQNFNILEWLRVDLICFTRFFKFPKFQQKAYTGFYELGKQSQAW